MPCEMRFDGINKIWGKTFSEYAFKAKVKDNLSLVVKCFNGLRTKATYLLIFIHLKG